MKPAPPPFPFMVMRAPDGAVIVVEFHPDGRETHRRIAADRLLDITKG